MPAIARKGAARAVKRRPAKKPFVVAMLDAAAIDPSPENRQADIDLAPLVESVRTYGIQMPIKVRPKGDRFEIVFGERRWRAAKELGLDTVPATVEDLTDEEAQARRVLENTQRKDPHALEEAEAYERLLATRDRKGKPIHTPESIGQVAGRSAAHVYNRLELTALAPELRKAFYAGELTVTGAFLIARGIPTALQAEAWERMRRYAEEEAYEDEFDEEGHLGTEAIETVIERDYAFRLDGAPFPVGDAKLVPAAGPCTSCPKRSVNQPALFSEPDRKDVCTDVSCWRAKVAALADRERREVFAVAGPSSSRRSRAESSTAALPSPGTVPGSTSARCPDHPDRLPWRELLGEFCPPPVLAFTPAGNPVRLAKKDEAIDALLRNGIDLGALRRRAEPVDDAVDDEDRLDDAVDAPPSARAAHHPADARFAADVDRANRQRILAAVVAAAEAAPPHDNRFVSLVYETILHGGVFRVEDYSASFKKGARPQGI